MQITKLKIFGFKSFAQRTEINFPTKGLTAVVGPNGCGKSNITDAIRWVLGEQKAALLRMSKMQDVIFSGTEERAAMSLAEVSIVIDNQDGTLGSEYSEIIVTRRVHRDGSGEYLINNQECRLRDVHALLFDSGLGSSTYSQMNADMIKTVLSDKADERRVLFEEAAGVSKYRQQRKEAVRQLERVQQDMERVEDNLRSVRRSVRLYETQAEKVNEYKRLNLRLRELDLSVSIDKYEDFKESMATLETSYKRLNHEVEFAKTKGTELQAKISEKQLDISEDENRYRELEREVQQATLALNDLNNSIVRVKDSISLLEEANEKATLEIERSKNKVSELEQEQAKIEEENEVLGSSNELDEMNFLLEREKETLQVMRDKVDELRTRTRELTNERLQALNQVNALKGRFERSDAETQILAQNIENWNAEISKQEEAKNDLETEKLALENEIANLNRSIEILDEQKLTREETATDNNSKISELENSIQQLQNEKAALESKVSVLKSIASENEEINKKLREKFSTQIRGVLSEFIEAPAEYSSPIETALGGLLDSLIIENAQLSKEIIETINQENLGQALLALTTSKRSLFNFNSTNPNIIGAFNQFVKVEPSLKDFFEGILSRYILVKDFDTALELSQNFAHEDLCFVSADAIVKTGGFVSAGTPTSGTLSRKNEISQSLERLAQIQEELNMLSANQEILKTNLEENATLLSSIVEDLREKQNELRSQESSLFIKNSSIEQCKTRLDELLKNKQNAEARIASLSASKNSDEELFNAERYAEKIENEFNDISDRLSEQEILYREKDEEIRELERSTLDKNSKILQNENRLKNIAEQIEFLENTILNRQEEIEKNETSKNTSEESIQKIADEIQIKDSELREIEMRRDTAREHYEVVSGDLNEWRSELDVLRDDMIDKMKELNEVSRRKDAIQSNVERLTERISSEWSIELENPENIERVEYSQPEADREIRDLRTKIKDLGPINIHVMDDYEDEKKRLEEVEKQFDDLDKARASLDRTITKLDDIARKRYLEAFERIQKNFQFVFSKLFLNGETKMSLIEKLDDTGKPIDVLDADIEINVRPTGKKMRGIKALSGGEQALTATALLFAIYMEKPSPYCVLDEVDGPLDDANVGRFMALLREFSKQTLFIVVTHNKRTMAEADMLYGVTQEIKGISRIASVQLADATRFAL